MSTVETAALPALTAAARDGEILPRLDQPPRPTADLSGQGPGHFLVDAVIAADIGKSLGGTMGSSVGRAIVRGTMGGILRR